MNSPEKSQIEQHVIDAIRQKRKEKGISQRELAYLLDVSVSFIGEVESGRTRAKYNLNHINEISKILDCSPKDFLPERGL
ncbi:MAG: helix-turn-helix transcriptional regulator [Flavipsychrobacter sp.]|nr:helix-turn-helix transcriptional regulator [Flavipsychrobacter sp.]